MGRGFRVRQTVAVAACTYKNAFVGYRARAKWRMRKASLAPFLL